MQNLLGSNHSGGAREMGTKDKKKKSKRRDDSSISPSSSGSGSDDSELSSKRRHRRDRSRGDESSRRDRERRRRKREKKERERERKRRKSRSGGKRKRRDDSDSSDGSSSGSESDDGSEPERPRVEPEEAVRDLLAEFPNVGDDLKQLLQMLDDGQAVDIKGVSEKSLCKHLKKLFFSLKLKESGDRVFMLHSKNRPTLEVVTPLLHNHAKSKEQQLDHSMLVEEANPVQKDAECGQAIGEDNLPIGPKIDALPPPRRVIGPAMPSAELLAAAAKLTEAQAELRDADLEEDAETFIGPPPPALVAEAESANEAERFEEVTRIMVAEADSPYDVLGVNHKMSTDNVKKRYWKLSLLVHPDKCPHPQANEAFIKLNKSFKDLQDPDKRKALDDKIKLKEEQEAFKVELKAMREAAQWRRIQGISMEGDDELLAEMEVKVAPQRDEWMTTLPPEKRPGGMPTHSTSFSKNAKEGRGDTTAWTDTPSERAQRAKTQYLEAYNQATALASNEEERKRQTSDADLVDKYNKAKRSISLVEKHQEEATKSSSKKKSKQKREKEEWKGQHPWKPWDREKDLTAGRQNVKLESGDMAAGLTSRFSSANFQRNFL